MTLFKTIMGGKTRKLGWVIDTEHNGKILVVRKTIGAVAVKTRRKEFVSINESAEQGQVGWALDERLVTAIRRFDVKSVGIFVPKPGIVYTTDAARYITPGQSYTWRKGPDSKGYRCVALEHFEKHMRQIKI